MADVDTSAASSRESLDEMLYQARYCPTLTDADWQEWRGTLRAILSERDAATARAEGAERERDAFKRNMEAAADLAARYGNQRDAATAERDRLREALRPQLGKNARRSLEELAEAMEASGDAADATALRFLLERQDAARAALAGAAKEA